MVAQDGWLGLQGKHPCVTGPVVDGERGLTLYTVGPESTVYTAAWDEARDPGREAATAGVAFYQEAIPSAAAIA